MARMVKVLVFFAFLLSVFGLSVGLGAAAKLPNFVGINYGPFHKDGQGPNSPIPDSQFLADMRLMAKKFTYIKTYGVDTASRLDQVVPLAKANFPKLKVFLGVHEDGSNHGGVTQPQLDLAISQANAYPTTVKCVVVGNECLPGDSTPVPVSVAQLIADLQYVRQGIANKNILVTTCLGFGSAQKYGNQLAPYCDVMMVNIYPFYAGPFGVDINGAWSNLTSSYGQFANQFSGKQVLVGETGWPSEGSVNGSAVPSIANEKTCINEILEKASQLGPIFAFEAFDEPWKSENSWAPHWGLWDKFGAPKFNFSTYLTRDSVWIGDVNGNGSEEVALLRHDLDLGKTQVHLRDGQTGKPIKMINFFGLGWTPVAVSVLQDLNGNGSQELAVLGFKNSGNQSVRVLIKDLDTGALISAIDFDSDFSPKELVVLENNTIGVLGTDASRNMTQMEVRNPLNGVLIKKITVNNEL